MTMPNLQYQPLQTVKLNKSMRIIGIATVVYEILTDRQRS